MTAARTLLERLRAGGFWLQPDAVAGRIIVSPASELTDELRALIRSHKAELLRVLAEPAATSLQPVLERRIRQMAVRWQYTQIELEETLDRARRDPVAWASFVALDEERQAEFEKRGVLPNRDA